MSAPRERAATADPMRTSVVGHLICLVAWASGAFHATLPRVRGADASRVLSSMSTEHFGVVLDEHTHVSLRKFTSTRFVMPGQKVPCLSLANIEVNSSARRQGHARRALRNLRSAAAATNQVLIIESAIRRLESQRARVVVPRNSPAHAETLDRAFASLRQTSCLTTCTNSLGSWRAQRFRAPERALADATTGYRPLRTRRGRATPWLRDQ